MRYYHQQQSQARSFDRSQRREPESVTIMMFCSNCPLININSFLSFLLTQRIRRDRQSGRHDVSFKKKRILKFESQLVDFLFHDVHSQEQVQEDARKRATLGMSSFAVFKFVVGRTNN